MNRRGFLGTLLGLVVAPVVVARVLSEYKPKPKVDSKLVGYKGSQFMNAGIVYAPYIPMLITPMTDIKPMRNSPSGKVFYMDYYTKHTII